MTPVRLVLIAVILGLVAFVGWSWIHVGSKYPLRPKDEWAGHTCGECRFRSTKPHGRCEDAHSLYAGWYRDSAQPACQVWQPMKEEDDAVEIT